jgi:hypothetical protein
MRAIVYARVSTDAQERDGTSLDTQEAACAEFTCRAGWLVVEGIRDIRVDIPARQVHVAYDETLVNVNRMKEVLQEEDYPVESVA